MSVVIVSVGVASCYVYNDLYLIPGDPAAVALGPRATEAMREAVADQNGSRSSHYGFSSGIFSRAHGQVILATRFFLTGLFLML